MLLLMFVYYFFSSFMAVVWPSATPSVLSGMNKIFTVANMIFKSSTTPMEAIYCRSIWSLL